MTRDQQIELMSTEEVNNLLLSEMTIDEKIDDEMTDWVGMLEPEGWAIYNREDLCVLSGYQSHDGAWAEARAMVRKQLTSSEE